MQKQKEFNVIANFPAVNKQVNEFLAACDLGISGAFVNRLVNYQITYIDGRVPDYEKTAKALITALKELGCTDIVVFWVNDENVWIKLKENQFDNS